LAILQKRRLSYTKEISSAQEKVIYTLYKRRKFCERGGNPKSRQSCTKESNPGQEKAILYKRRQYCTKESNPAQEKAILHKRRQFLQEKEEQ
jgi:hypothetical protein